MVNCDRMNPKAPSFPFVYTVWLQLFLPPKSGEAEDCRSGSRVWAPDELRHQELLEMQILGPTETDTLGWVPGLPGDCDAG